MHIIRSAIAGILALFAVTSADAQTYSPVPNHTVIGRIGRTGDSGPSQAIPFATLATLLNSTLGAFLPLGGGTMGGSIAMGGNNITGAGTGQFVGLGLGAAPTTGLALSNTAVPYGGAANQAGIGTTAVSGLILSGFGNTYDVEAQTRGSAHVCGILSSTTIWSCVGLQVNLGSDATGDLYYRNSSGNFARLGIGSTGNVLSVASGLPAWAPAGGAVTSVFGRTGVVVAATSDYTIGQIAGLGTGVATAAAAATNGTGGFATFNGNIGTTATGHASLDLAVSSLGTGVGTALAVATNTSGGFDTDKGAWTGYTPTLSCDGGTLTSATATGRSAALQSKTTAFTITVNITTVGTCSGSIHATLPNTSNNAFAVIGRDFGLGPAIYGNGAVAGTSVGMLSLSGALAGGNGSQLVVSGVYENQ